MDVGGFENAISSGKVREKGVAMSGDEPRNALIYTSQSYIGNHIGLIEEEGKQPYMGKCPFNRLLEDWRDFDMADKWTKFDCMVGAGLALLGARKTMPRRMEQKPIQFFDQ